MRVTVASVLALSLLVVSAGCRDGEEKQMDLQQRAEARAAEARAYVDELAALVGADPEVRQDDLTECELGGSGGLDLIYSLRVTVEPGTAERVRGEIADRYEADGWTVRRDPVDGDEVSTRFLKGTFAIGANVNERVGVASVGGSGGCVR